jgi:hypothetical protein
MRQRISGPATGRGLPGPASHGSQPLLLSAAGRPHGACSIWGLNRFCSRRDRTAHNQLHEGQLCVLQATDSGTQIGQMNARRVARSIACFVDFSEPAELIEGVPHASDRSRSICFSSCASAHVHESGYPICRLFCGLDRHQPSAGQPLTAHLRHLCPFRYSHRRDLRAFWSGPRGAAAGQSLVQA